MFPFDFVDSLSMFFIYAFVGWIVEVIYYGITEGHFVNRGFLNGPLCPVYGIGFYGVILLLLPVQDNFPVLFFGSMFITTVVEFLAGFILYKAFELRWWDYRQNKFNIMGFVCLKFSIYWGIACSLAIKLLHPLVWWILENTPFIVKLIVLSAFTAMLIFDIVDTVVAIIGFKKKIKILTDVTGEIKRASDTIGKEIYEKVEVAVTFATPRVENYELYKKMYSEHRAEEQELFKRNTKEERALLASFLKEEKQAISKTKESANEKITASIGVLKKNEKRLMRRLIDNGKDSKAKVLEFLQTQKEKF